ncbi:calcium-dependent secretion activator 1 [Clonorchis sinensis]|uniref:Calcium-dependent secretion activator 1 n=1 Tax=Clonorchis sinensis TaxID=79923 RepID=G7YN12_CLOSI|nr:calcium-dependent secretion activator 1 [Clonorchis sinensis]
MLTTSSSEEEEFGSNDVLYEMNAQSKPTWKESEDRSEYRQFDLRTRQDHLRDPRINVCDQASTSIGLLAGAKQRATKCPSTGWQPLNFDQHAKFDLSKGLSQRAPLLSAIPRPHPYQIPQGTSRDSPASDNTARTSTGATQFSVSFEGISESGPMGTRLSPVGSSCWSSEQHISQDSSSLISSSTNSVSAGRSMSSGKQQTVQGHAPIPLQRQPSSGTAGSGGNYSLDTHHLQSASHSVRSAPLCLGSPIQTRYFRQLTLDTQPNPQQGGPTPPSLVVSDPEEEQHRRTLQIYVFAVRCVAYPILSPITQGPTRRYLRVNKDYLLTLKERFQSFLKGELAISCDEAFRNAISDFFEVVLKSDRIASMVKSGSCSMYDLREVFITNIERRFQNQQLIEGLSRENVISAWKIKFDQICRGGERPCPVAMKLAVPQPEVVSPTKEQLYELLMRTLSVEKYEHQVLFNACQLDNADEQAAQIRRELSERLSLIEKMARERSYPKLVHKEMESQYIDEERLRVNELIRRVDAIPVMKSYAGGSGQVQRRFRKKTIRGMLSKIDDNRVSKSEIELNAEADLWSKQYGIESASVRGAFGSSSAISEQIMPTKELIAGTLHGHGISREAIRMNFSLDILIHQLRNVRSMANKRLYCTVELDGTADKKRTETVEARSPVWDTTAEFQTFQPLPLAKVRVHKECSGPLSLEDKEIGKIVLYPCWTSPRVPTWFRLLPTKHCHDALELQISVTMRRPTNCKYANHCWIQGRTTFKKWKRRYICLIQVSQYTFVLAAYGEQKSHPTEFMALDGFTVDYCESRPELMLANSAARTKPDHNVSSSSLNSLSKLRLLGSIVRPSSQQHIEDSSGMSRPEADGVASFFFKLVREGDSVIVATSTEVDRQSWVQAIYRATGQTHKPTMPGHPASSLSTGTPVREFEGSRHSGIEELATTPVYSVDHFDFFCELQAQSLNQRLQDSFVSLGWPSPGQKMLLEEYCARYGIRECQRHLAFLKNLLDKAEHGVQIDPDLFHLSYSLCANHVTGKTQHAQAVHTVLAVEREQFQYIKQRLTTLLEKQITEFRYCFPFGRPEGALEKTISLLERVLTKETGEPASADLVRNTIKTCLRNAAVLNYERISEYATIEAVSGFRIQGVDAANKRMYEMIHLAELCIEVLKQNEEHHAESFSWFSDLFVAHAENFWSLFQMDLFDFLDQLPDYRWEIFELFQLLNDYLLNDTNLCNGHFHQNLASRFAPLVDSYIELMAELTEQALITGYQNERWLPSITVVAGAGRMEVLPNGDAQSGLKVHSPLVATGSASYTDNVTTFAGTDAMKQRLSVNLGAQQNSPGEFRRSLGGSFQNPLFSVSGLPFTSEPFSCPESSSGMIGSRACQTVIELLWRLHKLKYFVQELAWPQPVKAKDLNERIRVLCAQMLREGVKRTLIELESTVRKCSKNTDLILPIECCTMLNTVTELRSHLFSLCHSVDTNNSSGSPTKGTTQNANQLHIETEEFFEGVHRNMLVIVVDQLVAVLNGVLGKLTRFDENKLLSSILSLTKPTDEEGRAYSVFVHNNLQQLNDNLVDEVSLISLCENWYNRQIRMLYEWLVHRKSILLHPYQIKCLSVIVKKTFSYFELQGLPKSVLDTIMYQTVSHRLQVDETTQCVRQETGSMPPSGKGKRKVLDNLSGGISALSGSAIFRRN